SPVARGHPVRRHAATVAIDAERPDDTVGPPTRSDHPPRHPPVGGRRGGPARLGARRPRGAELVHARARVAAGERRGGQPAPTGGRSSTSRGGWWCSWSSESPPI